MSPLAINIVTLLVVTELEGSIALLDNHPAVTPLHAQNEVLPCLTGRGDMFGLKSLTLGLAVRMHLGLCRCILG